MPEAAPKQLQAGDQVPVWIANRLRAGVVKTLGNAGGPLVVVVEDQEQRRQASPQPADDPWRLDEWHALPATCLIAGCDTYEIDERGPVWLGDGSMHKACVEHWEAIHRILGEQATWEQQFRD